MPELTNEQKAAVESRGKVIVSASAGSGKTFVMIEKLVRAIEGGADLDSVLAVTFTKKAAAQMKEKLRKVLIERIESAEWDRKTHIKSQLSKIPSANISTIHSLCSHLLRTYFYALGIDGGFDIMADEDPTASELKSRALDEIFDMGYDSDDKDFTHLLKCFSKKRSDYALRRLVLEGYSAVRTVAHYRELLENTEKLYTVEGFNGVCAELSGFYSQKYNALFEAVKRFEADFPETANAATYNKIFNEMLSALYQSAQGGAFAPQIPLNTTKKPRDKEEDKDAGELFKAFKKEVSDKYSAVREGLSDEQTEFNHFMESGRTAVVYSRLLLQFDEVYARIKREENKLDYNDLEHLTLQLLQDENVRKEINSRYRYVFVDEYQDVNPVQEEIISSMGGEVFLVGDVKQAIYGFRGSKSLFFAQKYNRFEGGEGTALRLSSNFRSCKTVLDFVNDLFSEVMTEDVCGFNYRNNAEMHAGGAYPADCGSAGISVFGEDEEQEEEEKKRLPVYSVVADGRDTPHTKEGLAVLQLVERALSSQHYDLNKGCLVDTQPGDICILTRKNRGESTEGIVRALTDAGYPVAGAQEANICALPEVKQMLDILSLIDNAEQDVPLASAMLSPLGGFTEDELAAVRIAFKRERKLSFRTCVKLYAQNMRDLLAQKLNIFSQKLNTYRDFAEIMTAGELIDKILEDSGLEAEYSANGGAKLKNILRLAAEGPKLTLSAFLQRVKAGGYNISAPSSAPTDSIKIMTMHAAKGLEFPVVIIADVCRTFKGRDYSELPFDDEYGFAPKHFDTKNMLVRPTILRRLVKLRADREELKNELNLFYVACTRAMCKLYVLAEDIKEQSVLGCLDAKCYAQTFDMGKFPVEKLAQRGEIEEQAREVTVLAEPDEGLVEAIERRFMKAYSHAASVELPVKSSASAILKSLKEDEPYFIEHTLFSGEGETGTERGTAYHRFLELCDFSAKDVYGVEKQLKNMLTEGLITPEQAELLDAARLSEILNMPVFDNLCGAKLYREREFLCRLKACDVLDTPAEDFILVQGAIDLMAVCGEGANRQVKIIDYKYSKKTDEQLIATYSKQLALYKKAVSVIMHLPEEKISTAIVNIYRRTQIIL